MGEEERSERADFRRPTGGDLGEEAEADRSSGAYADADRREPPEPDPGDDDVAPVRDEPGSPGENI